MTDILDRDHSTRGSPRSPVPVDPSPDGQALSAAQQNCVVGSPSANGHHRPDDYRRHGAPSSTDDAPDPRAFAALRTLAESFEDAQKARIAIQLRTSPKKMKDGTTQPAPIPPEVVADALAAMEQAEKKLALAMKRAFRKAMPDVYAWVKETPGIGEHLMARLIGTIGHPVIANPYHWEGNGPDRVLVADDPFVRNVAKLWAYCGHGDPSRKRRKGMSAEDGAALGNPRAKMLTHLLAEGCMKCVGSPARVISVPKDQAPAADTNLSGDQHSTGTHSICVPAGPSTDDAIHVSTPNAAARRRSPYRDTYDLARLTYADREGWSPGHQHNAALRFVGKAILADLWQVAQ